MCKSVYDPSFHPARATYLLAERGYTDAELADAFGIVPSTLYNWRNKYPELNNAVKLGKDTSNEIIIGAMFKNVTGYMVEEVEDTIEIQNGKEVIVERKRKTKHIPGNPTVQIFAAKNRMPDRWRDRQEIKHEFAELSDAELIERAKSVLGGIIQPGTAEQSE